MKKEEKKRRRRRKTKRKKMTEKKKKKKSQDQVLIGCKVDRCAAQACQAEVFAWADSPAGWPLANCKKVGGA